MVKKRDKETKKSSKKNQEMNKDSKKDKTIPNELKDKKRISFSFSKRPYLLIIPVVLIIIIASIFLFFDFSETVDAQLIIDSGFVQVKHLGSWSTATNGMDLYESDIIKTGINASASIILFKGSIIRLNESTVITLKEIILGEELSVSIQQDAGRTWNTIEKISGIDNYEVQTPTTVASVRGTSFDVNVEAEGDTIISVIRGIVNISRYENGTLYSIDLNQNQSIIVSHEEIGDKLDSHGLLKDFKIDDWIEGNIEKDDRFIGDIKEKIYENINPYIGDLKNIYGMTDEEIDVLIEGYIKGDFSLPPETPEKYKDLFDLS